MYHNNIISSERKDKKSVIFGRPFVKGKRVRPMLWDRCLSVCPVLFVCPVCNVGVLWPNGWTDQDETWHAGIGPSHIVLDGDPVPPPQRGTAPNFRPISVVVKRLDGSRCHLVWR